MILKKQQKRKKQQIIEEQSLGDCSCQMLDTSLQDVGDSDCSCSQCLEAHLQAFNELKELQQQMEKQNSSQHFRGFSSKRNENVKTRQGTRIRQQQNDKTKKRLMDYKSLGKIERKHANTSMESKNNEKNENQMFNSQYFPPKFSSQFINEYVLIARHRARQYLQERKKLQKNQIEERLKLKQLIKQNLMALRYTTQAIRQQEKIEGKPKPVYKWNHTPYMCKSRQICRKTNIYNPDLENKAEQIEQIKARIKKYKQENKQKPYECPDKCPRHHLRTSKAKLDEIEKYIKEKANAMQAKHKKQKKQKIKQQKIKQAKLRAIDLKCKQILERTKKYDSNISRTSFHNSLDHFSTFSQLKEFKQQKDAQKQKQKKRKFKIQEKQEGGRIQEKIYWNLEEQLIGDHPPIQSRIKKQNKALDQDQQEQQWCQKIVYDAKIKPPKEIKKEDLQSKNKKNIKKEKQVQKPTVIKQKRQSEVTLKKEQQRRKELQKEIERKKQQIYKEFQKRNSSFASKQGQSKYYRRKP